MPDQDATIVTAADEAYAHLALGLLASIKDAAHHAGVDPPPIHLIDLGLSSASKSKANCLSRVVAPRVPAIPKHQTMQPPFELLAYWVKPHVSQCVPGFNWYVWIDADAWVQDWSAIQWLLEGAKGAGLAAVPEIAPGYAVHYEKGSRHLHVNYHWYVDAFGPEVGRDLIYRPVFNSGVWAAAASSAIWDQWQRQLRAAFENARTTVNDQPAFNRAIYHHAVPYHPLPARCNWVCCHAAPHWSAAQGALVEPTLPHDRIGILHLTRGCCGKILPIPTTTGSERHMCLEYEAVRDERSPAAASAVTGTARGATGDDRLLVLIPTCGLCNRLRAIASAHRLARITRRRLLVCWEPTPECGAAFEDLFENHLPSIAPHAIDRAGVQQVYADRPDKAANILTCVQNRIRRDDAGDVVLIVTCGYVAFHDEPISNLENQQPAPFRQEIQHWLRQLRPVAPVRRRVEELMERFAVQEDGASPAYADAFASHTVGVHIRRTDHHDAIENSPDHRFHAAMDAVLRDDPLTRFFLATDCAVTEAAFLHRYGERTFVAPKVSRRPPSPNNINNREHVEPLRDALVDLVMLSQTRLVLGSYGSTFSWAAEDLSTRGTRVSIVR